VKFSRSNFILAACSVIITLLVAEVVLSNLYPYGFEKIGHQYAENAKRYGWGFRPGETVRIVDPDSGAIYTDHLNDKGWRDREHDFENRDDSFRILILGDSNTFGAIVPREQNYPRVLEERFAKQGYRVEVVSIAYEGWGTDQQLEALQLEGLKYHPDLVILQFTTNDLEDNNYFHARLGNERCTKPFYFELNEHDELVRRENPCFADNQRHGWKQTIKELVSRSEILKRLYALYRHSGKPETMSENAKYVISETRLAQLKMVLNLSDEDLFLKQLKALGDGPIAETQLGTLISHHHRRSQVQLIKLLLENQPFQEYWKPSVYRPKTVDPSGNEWQLYFALIERAGSLVRKHGGRMSVFSDNGIGQMEWELYWHRLSNDAVSKDHYLAPSRLIRQFALRNGFGYIENSHKHQRGRNDPHPNVDGNQAMAKNIYEYVIKTFSIPHVSQRID